MSPTDRESYFIVLFIKSFDRFISNNARIFDKIPNIQISNQYSLLYIHFHSHYSLCLYYIYRKIFEYDIKNVPSSLIWLTIYMNCKDSNKSWFSLLQLLVQIIVIQKRHSDLHSWVWYMQSVSLIVQLLEFTKEKCTPAKFSKNFTRWIMSWIIQIPHQASDFISYQ